MKQKFNTQERRGPEGEVENGEPVAEGGVPKTKDEGVNLDDKYLLKKTDQAHPGRRTFLKGLGAVAVGAALGVTPEDGKTAQLSKKGLEDRDKQMEREYLEYEASKKEAWEKIEKIKAEPGFTVSHIQEFQDALAFLMAKKIRYYDGVAQDNDQLFRSLNRVLYSTEDIKKRILSTNGHFKHATARLEVGYNPKSASWVRGSHTLFMRDLNLLVADVAAESVFTDLKSIVHAFRPESLMPPNVKLFNEIFEHIENGYEKWHKRITEEIEKKKHPKGRLEQIPESERRAILGK